MIHHDMTTKKITVSTICEYDLMQQPMVQFLANFGLYTLIIKCREAVTYLPLVGKWKEFLYEFFTIWDFFKEMDTYSLNGHQRVLQQLYLISTVMLKGFNLNIIWKSLKNTNILFFQNKIIKNGENHMKAAKFKGLSWLKHCTGHICIWKT